MLIYIVRHGETNGNLRALLQGWTDEPLNSKGEKLAKVTAAALADIKFDTAISSPLIRAYETCRIILAYNKNKTPEIRTDVRLKEIYFGEWENRSILKDSGDIPTEQINRLFSDPYRLENTYQGETVFDVCERTGAFYRELIQCKEWEDKTILVTTHGYALRCMLQQVYEDKTDFWHGRVPDNCAVNIIEVKNGIGKLIGDDLLFYDESLAMNPYAPDGQEEI